MLVKPYMDSVTLWPLDVKRKGISNESVRCVFCIFQMNVRDVFVKKQHKVNPVLVKALRIQDSHDSLLSM